MTEEDSIYGAVQTAEELGRLARAHRKHRHLTLETVSGLGNLSTRFLSEFELRTLGLEVIIQPRGRATPPHRTGKTREKIP